MTEDAKPEYANATIADSGQPQSDRLRPQTEAGGKLRHRTGGAGIRRCLPAMTRRHRGIMTTGIMGTGVVMAVLVTTVFVMTGFVRAAPGKLFSSTGECHVKTIVARATIAAHQISHRASATRHKATSLSETPFHAALFNLSFRYAIIVYKIEHSVSRHQANSSQQALFVYAQNITGPQVQNVHIPVILNSLFIQRRCFVPRGGVRLRRNVL